MTPQEKQEVLLEFLGCVIEFCHVHEIRDPERLRTFHLREALDHALWKLVELDGKYGGRFISKGVYDLKRRFNCDPCVRSGKWPDEVLSKLDEEGHFDGDHSRKSYDCRLDHVISREFLRTELLAGRIKPQNVCAHLLGCVVLKCEHDRMRDNAPDVSDPWCKYRVAGIEVFERVSGRRLDISEGSEDSRLRNLDFS